MTIQLGGMPNTYTARTTNNTPLAVAVFTMSDESVGSLEAIVSALSTTGVAASWRKFVCIKRHNGVVSIVDTVLDIIGARKDPGALLWTVDVNASGNNIQVMLAGGAIATIDWMITASVLVYTP